MSLEREHCAQRTGSARALRRYYAHHHSPRVTIVFVAEVHGIVVGELFCSTSAEDNMTADPTVLFEESTAEVLAMLTTYCPEVGHTHCCPRTRRVSFRSFPQTNAPTCASSKAGVLPHGQQVMQILAKLVARSLISGSNNQNELLRDVSSPSFSNEPLSTIRAPGPALPCTFRTRASKTNTSRTFSTPCCAHNINVHRVIMLSRLSRF
jgi:hypothetical protein